MFLQSPQLPSRVTFAGGEAGNDALFKAAFDSAQYVDNSNAASAALQKAYSQRIDAVRAVTGVTLADPMDEAEAEFRRQAVERPQSPLKPAGDRVSIADLYQKHADAFAGRLVELQRQFPDHQNEIGAGRDVRDDALQVARDADANQARLFGSRDDLWKWAVSFAGGGLASLKDPVTVGSMFVGGGAGGARTFAGRILATAFSEALVNGASEAAMQPAVQAWREKAGLPHGFDEAMRNVGFATAFGGVLGGGGRAVGEALSTFGKLPDRTLAALNGDNAVLAESLAPIRDALPAEARGALDAAARDGLADNAAIVDPQARAYREKVLADFEAAAIEGRTAPQWEPDPAQVSRISDRIAPPVPREFEPIVYGADIDELMKDMRGATVARDIPKRPVYAFLKGRGGIDPQSQLAGDLQAAGVTRRQFPGLFAKQGGARDNVPFDEAVDALPALAGRAENDGNGYVNPQTWYQALTDELRGEPWLTPAQEIRLAETSARADRKAALAREGVDLAADRETVKAQLAKVADAERRILEGDEDFALPSDFQIPDFMPPAMASRLYASGVVEDLARRAGPAVDDELIEAAAYDVLHNRTDPQDALDEVMGIDKAEYMDPEDPGLPEYPPDAHGVDDPMHPDPLFTDLTDADFEGLADDDLLPFDGELVSIAGLKENIARQEWLGRVVEVCKA